MPTRLKATVRYDGAGFAGWQVQPERRTVQGELERVLSQIASQPVRVFGASRTDAGVHALGQVMSFDWPGPLEAGRLQRSLSKMLGPEIRIERLEEAPADFHACACARGKRYAYVLSRAKHPDPFSARYAWCVPWALDLDRLEALGHRLEGTRDFAGFQAAGASTATTVRTLESIRLKPGGVVAPCDAGDRLVTLVFHGNGFLYKMVRNLTGTLIDITRGAVPESRLDELLAAPAPYHGYTAPSRGLFLMEVLY